MAIVRPINVRRGNLAGLRAVIDYVKDIEKTKGGKLVYMSGGIAGREFDDMLLAKKVFGKTTGRQYAHFIQSFHSGDKLTPELAFRIGREYMASLEQWRDFQTLMAVHTNTEHLHIHYIINSVNSRTGSKWQCSKQDLKLFRDRSDEFCRRYNLHVIEHGNRGHKSYGENKAYQEGNSWKQRLATDIAECLNHAKSRTDFIHWLAEYGLDVDFGFKNAMFFISAGTYGLSKDMKCSDYALRSYGDFSKENIYNHFKVNKGLMELALEDIPLLQDALLEVGRALFPDDYRKLEGLYLGGTALADFDKMTREEIEAYLKREKLEQLRKKALVEREKDSQGSGLILATIADTLELINDYRNENQIDFNFVSELDLKLENEYEM